MRGSHPFFDVKFSRPLQHPSTLIATSNTFDIPNLAIQSECDYQQHDFELLEMSVLRCACGWGVLLSECFGYVVFFCLLVIVYRCICVVLSGLFAPLLPICCSFGQLAETHTKFLVWDITTTVPKNMLRYNNCFRKMSTEQKRG